MTMQRWLIAAAMTCVAAAGCSKADGEAASNTRRPQQADQGTNPLNTAGHLASVEVAGLSGDQRTVQAHLDAMRKNRMRDMRLADPARHIGRASGDEAFRKGDILNCDVRVTQTKSGSSLKLQRAIVKVHDHKTASNQSTLDLGD